MSSLVADGQFDDNGTHFVWAVISGPLLQGLLKDNVGAEIDRAIVHRSNLQETDGTRNQVAVDRVLPVTDVDGTSFTLLHPS